MSADKKKNIAVVPTLESPVLDQFRVYPAVAGVLEKAYVSKQKDKRDSYLSR